MKKIMFTDDLTRAVLEERKTMTRRTMAVQTDDLCARLRVDEKGRCCWMLAGDYPEGGRFFRPPFEANSIVALAQRYSDIVSGELYADELLVDKLHLEDTSGWSNKMYVAADLMPHKIRMNSWRVERLQDISDEDCLREGVRKLESEGNPTMFTFDGWKFKNKVNRCVDSPKEAFAALIDKISGKGTWNKNPWVWVYWFQLVR